MAKRKINSTKKILALIMALCCIASVGAISASAKTFSPSYDTYSTWNNNHSFSDFSNKAFSNSFSSLSHEQKNQLVELTAGPLIVAAGAQTAHQYINNLH